MPTAEEVPGGGRFARVDDLAFVVAADDLTTVSLVYRILREMTALLTVRSSEGDEVDVAKLESQLNLALSALTEFDGVGRLAGKPRRTWTTSARSEVGCTRSSTTPSPAA